jgi:phosphopantothenate-cysteine ligase
MNVIVAGGGTIAPIDDVRHITNVSTGRFAAAITEACLGRGCSVWHIHTPGALVPFHRLASFALDTPEPAAEHARLETLRGRWRAVRDRLSLNPLALGTVADYANTLRGILESRSIDVVFLPIAVSDYEPEPKPGKISSDHESITISCGRAPKVIRSVRDWSPEAYLVGFKLLSNASRAQLLESAAESGRRNRLDLVVANDLRSVRSGRHEVDLVRPGRLTESLPPGDDLARRLVDRVLQWAAEPRERPGLSQP